MEATAHARYVRISPRKVSIVGELIRGKDTKTAMAILKHTPKAASEPLLKTLGSAVANAENNHDMDADNLIVSKVLIGPGPVLKRIMPRAQGRAFRILKRTSHITITVCEKEQVG
ncbi:MAG: 50S ribosomal protein L22 [Oscillospiraceae bacterium]|jgi:large subunit ribosomal protein L22|nr:50S ribosomal protein L22 [Oscillospiraceae bacterium]